MARLRAWLLAAAIEWWPVAVEREWNAIGDWRFRPAKRYRA